jgi:hypothetical protein
MKTNMRRMLIPSAAFWVAILAIGVICSDRVVADEMKVISSDANARFVALGISKAIVIDLPRDIKDVLVGEPSIVSAVVKSERRVYIIGLSVGQTNVYFFDAKGDQIDGLNVAVLTHSQQAELQNYPFPAQTVLVYRGALVDEVGIGNMAGDPWGDFVTLSCTPFRCLDARQPGAGQAPGTQNFNITGNAGGSVLLPAK